MVFGLIVCDLYNSVAIVHFIYDYVVCYLFNYTSCLLLILSDFRLELCLLMWLVCLLMCLIGVDCLVWVVALSASFECYFELIVLTFVELVVRYFFWFGLFMVVCVYVFVCTVCL